MSWKDTSVTGYPEFTREQGRGCDQTVSADADGITTEERMSGYEGWTATVHVPLDVLRRLLANSGLHIVTEAEKRVLDACAALRIVQLKLHEGKNAPTKPAVTSNGLSELAVAELARRTP
jgi:hypothetical protein